MQRNLGRKFKTLLLICLATGFAGVIYQLVSEQLVNASSVLFGLPLGLVFGVMELFVFSKAEKRFRRWSFTKLIVFKTLAYTAVIFGVNLLVTATIGMLQGRQLYELIAVLHSFEPWVLLIYTLVVYSLIVFMLQINRLLGEGVLWKFISGKYHKPREEERIFMFLDMKSSTSIAEQLGHVKFYDLLNELFHEISYPVLHTKAEIYQYIGDEVVLTWEMDDGMANANCLRAFFMFRERLIQNGERYLGHFGVKPEFKAGVHFGKVTSAQIGELKREIVYNGDVLNTASRIQSACNTYQRDCLVSGSLMNKLSKHDEYEWERIGAVTLRGKEKEVELFSVNVNH